MFKEEGGRKHLVGYVKGRYGSKGKDRLKEQREREREREREVSIG
jgi:hypothetical protein